MARIDWFGLPLAARRAVEAHTGPVLDVEPVPDGLTCSMAAVLTTGDGRLFVKGVPLDDEHGVAAQFVEAAVNPAVRTVGPRLIAHVQTDGWDLLVFEHVPGRHADLSAGSRDLPPVVEVLDMTSGIVAPVWVPFLTDRYAPYLDAGEVALLDGMILLHTDTNPHNLIVHDGQAWMVDWAMVAAGPAWVDTAFTAVRLMEAGCTPAQALGWAAGCRAWRRADPAAVQALVTGVCREWEHRVGAQAARSSNTRYRALLGTTVDV